MVTNTSKISIRVGSVVVSPGKSVEVDSGALAKMRHEDAAPAARALGEALVDGVPTVKKMTTEEQKAEAGTIIDEAKKEAGTIIDEALDEAEKSIDEAKKEAAEITGKAKAEAAKIEKLMVKNKKALAVIGK